MVTDPKKAFIMGGTYRIPVLAGLQAADFIDDMRRDGTFNPTAFAREYESKWSGTSDGAFFSGEDFDRCRILQKPEWEYSERNNKGQCYYVISADIGRKGDLSAVLVFRVIPQPIGPSQKNLVNIYSWENMHFEEQAINLKKLYYKYNARRLVIDGNGAGIGLIDYLVKPQFTEDATEKYPSFGIYNDEEGFYKQFIQPDTERNAVYVIKANAPLNTEAHTNAQVQMASGKLKMLIDERTAGQKLNNTKMGQLMTAEERAEYLKPYVLTTILKDEMLNLREESEGLNIILKRANRSIRKDKFSSLEYGLYYIKTEEENKKKKKKFNAKEWAFFSPCR